MPSPELVRVRIGQTALRAQRVGESELLVEDLLALDPGDVISVDGEDRVVVHAAASRNAPGPYGPAPQTRIAHRPAGTGAAPA